jgi:hypothetical protein
MSRRVMGEIIFSADVESEGVELVGFIICQYFRIFDLPGGLIYRCA